MRSRTLVVASALVAALVMGSPGAGHAQIVKKLKRAAQHAAESEAQAQVDRLVRDAIRCLVDDPVCVQEANASGQDVVFVDDDGNLITDDKGAPITDPEAAAAAAPPPVAPGDGAWANYDFVPGEEVMFYDDFANDNVGDFPRRMDLVQGNWEIVQWQGGRYLRATSGGLLAIPLPDTLPDRFTVETTVSFTHGNANVRVMPGRAYYGPARSYRGSVAIVQLGTAGVRPVSNQGPTALGTFEPDRVRKGVAPFRIMADGDYMKVYLGEQRVANVPNAVFPRSDTLFIAATSASDKQPILLGPIRIASGGADLYDKLETDGRAVTHGILFATNSDRIRPESTPTIEEIGTMLQQHPELRLRIEGHTDSVGVEGYNQDLSERRAASVKAFLVERYTVDATRLETVGFGESKPVADNGTPEGRQQNRRVELVKLEPTGA